MLNNLPYDVSLRGGKKPRPSRLVQELDAIVPMSVRDEFKLGYRMSFEMDVEELFARQFGFRIIGYSNQRETDERGLLLIPGALPPGMRSDEEWLYCASHRYGRMYCGRSLADSAGTFSCDDCALRGWFRPLCDLCRESRCHTGTKCFKGSCPAASHLGAGQRVFGDGYRAGDDTCRRWLAKQIIRHTAEQRLAVIEKKFPNLAARALHYEESAGGQGQMPLVQGFAAEPYAAPRSNRKREAATY